LTTGASKVYPTSIELSRVHTEKYTGLIHTGLIIGELNADLPENAITIKINENTTYVG